MRASQRCHATLQRRYLHNDRLMVQCFHFHLYQITINEFILSVVINSWKIRGKCFYLCMIKKPNVVGVQNRCTLYNQYCFNFFTFFGCDIYAEIMNDRFCIIKSTFYILIMQIIGDKLLETFTKFKKNLVIMSIMTSLQITLNLFRLGVCYEKHIQDIS